MLWEDGSLPLSKELEYRDNDITQEFQRNSPIELCLAVAISAHHGKQLRSLSTRHTLKILLMKLRMVGMS
jgi:hypothetical protein